MQKGQLIAGRFELVAKVATGGMGSIFRARDLTSGSPVAVKTWPPTRSAFDPITEARKRERAFRRFEREAAALADIDHPAVVRYIAHGVTASAEPFLVMDWVEGHDLADKLASSGLDVTETLELAERVLAALAVLHARGVVHRDLKPANVMLEGGRARHAVLVDFGIARGSQPLVVTHRGAQLGTPCYMSPEQIRDPRAVDGRADVFALGCIVFECLTGTRAFQDADALGTIAQVLLEGAPDLSQIRPDLPAPVVSFAMSLLASDREQRPFADAALLAHVSRLVLACKKQPFGPPSPRRDAPVGRTGRPAPCAKRSMRKRRRRTKWRYTRLQRWATARRIRSPSQSRADQSSRVKQSSPRSWPRWQRGQQSLHCGGHLGSARHV